MHQINENQHSLINEQNQTVKRLQLSSCGDYVHKK